MVKRFIEAQKVASHWLLSIDPGSAFLCNVPGLSPDDGTSWMAASFYEARRLARKDWALSTCPTCGLHACDCCPDCEFPARMCTCEGSEYNCPNCLTPYRDEDPCDCYDLW